MKVAEPRSRRTFLAQLGKGTGALVLFSLAACVPATSSSSRSSQTAAPPPDPTDVSLDPVDGSLDPIESDPGDQDVATPVAEGAVRWNRVNLGFVSAYILVRGGEAAVVDTGVAGSEDDIENALTAIGLEWDAVGHVILTHRHPDHAGSVAAVLDRARAATGYAGAEDLPSITVPRELRVAADGDDVFGLRIVTTPGHTKGHISVLDPIGGVLVAGDALNTANGAATGPNPDFSEDMQAANASVAKLAKLHFETLLVGHGDPVEGGAQASVAALVS